MARQMELNRDAESLAIKYEQMEDDEASIPALQDKLRKAEQKNALLERNQKMLHEKMANIDELITKFTAVNAQLKQKSQRLAHSQQEIEQLKRQLAEASAAAASYSQSLRAKTVELEATKTAMSETLQENEALMCEKSSMQALNAQLSAEIEGGSRWIDEQRAMHKELSRVRRELSYEKTRYTARAKEAVDLTLEVRKQTNENIEAREELRGLKALVKQLEVVLAERGMESVYGEAVKEVQRQQALEKQLREERELQAARLAEKRRLERELRAETFVPYSDHDHDHDHGDDEEEGAEVNAGLNLSASTAAGDKAGDANATKEKERQKKNEKEKKNEEDGRDLEQLLSQEIDRAMSGDGAAAATQPADTTPSGRGKGRGGRQAKDSSSAVGRVSKVMADTPAKRGRGRGRASAAKVNATGPSPSTDTSESASPGPKGAAGGRRPGEARGRGRGRGRGEKRKPEPSPREVLHEEEGPTQKRKRTAAAAGTSSGGEPMEEGHEEDESFDEFASFLETAFEDDTEEALAGRPAPPAATANVVPTPPRDAMVNQANVGEEQSATTPTTGATTTAAAALEMVHEMMMADTSLPATPITPLPSTPVAFLSSCPSTPIRYSSFPPPSPVRQASSSSFPSYSSSSASASSTPPAATPPSPSRSTRSPSTPASSSSSVVSSPSPSASPQSLRRTSHEFEPSLFSESEQEDNVDDDHQMDVPTLLRPAIDDQQQPRPADAVAASETRPSLTASLESELAAAPTRPAVDERPSELKEKREDEEGKAKEREKRQEEEREHEERQRRQRETKEREERDRREKEEKEEKEREAEEKRKQEEAAAEQERRAKEERERRKKEAEEKEEEAKRTKAKEEEEAKRRAREAEELRAREEGRRKQELHEKQERERIAAEEKEKEKKENEAKEKKEREIAEKEKEKEAKGKEKESTDEKKEAKEATEAKRAEGEKEGKRETKRKREDDAARPPPVAVVVERSRRPRELQQLYFSRRVEQLGGGGGGEGTKGVAVEELAEDFSDDKNIKEADLLSCLEGLVRKGRPATSPRKACPTPKPKRARQPTVDGESPQLQVGEGEEEPEGEREQEALLADLVWRVDGLRRRRQADEKAGRLKRPAEKRNTKRLAEQMVLRLEAGLCRGTTTTTATTTNGRHGFGAVEARMVRLLVGLGRRLSEEAGDARARGEEEMRTWRVLVHHFTACLGTWRGWRDRPAAAAAAAAGTDDSNEEGPKAVAAFVEVLDDVVTLWSDAMRIDTTAAHDHDQHDMRRRKKGAMGVVYRVVVLLLDEVTTATPGQEETQLKKRWHGVRDRCGWDAIGAVDENALLADIMAYCRALGRHGDEESCKWDEETTLVLRSMELLALGKGWEWTYQVLVNHVWPMLSETAPDEGHTSVAAALRLIGLMSRRAFGDSPTGHPPREGQRDKVDWLRSTLDMVIAPPPPSLDDGTPPIPVFSFRCQLAAVESLRDLFSPTDDGASLAAAKAWLASLSVDQRKRVPVALKKALA